MGKTFFYLPSFIVLITSWGCSMNVREAYAPTNPPKVQKSLFALEQLEGHFQGNTTLMFLWPDEIKNEETGEMIPMTFAQKADSRKNIVRYDEEQKVYKELFEEAERQLNAKYDKKSSEMVAEYQNLKCYTLCDVDDFACTPDDPSNLFQDTWKQTEDEVELQTIATCQQNEKDRKGIDGEKEQEKAQAVTPLQKKAGEAAQNLLDAVGDSNFFNNLSSFEMTYGPWQVVGRCGSADPCLPPGYNHKLIVKVAFSGGVITNSAEDGAIAEVTNLKLDAENGYLNFTIPAIDFDNGNKEYGKIHFDLELSPNGQQLNVTGDIRLESNETGTIKVGRFSSSGGITPLEQ